MTIIHVTLRIGNNCNVGIISEGYEAINKLSDEKKKQIIKNFAMMIGVSE